MTETQAIPATLTLTAAAEYIGVSKAVFYRDVYPTVPVVRALSGHARFRRADLDRWLEEHTEGPAES